MKVLIKKGCHQLVVGSVGTVVSQDNDVPETFEVKGEDKNHVGRTIVNELIAEEFEVIND